jgi:catechol 2,3-dioxygenase-like lactoylglutathione lyase family enzyme
MDWTLEVVVVPVASQDGGVDRAIAFYRDQLGFHLDHHTKTADMNFAQLTPPGSGCSIVIGELPGGPAMATGSLKGLQLVVADAYRARDELLARGVDVGEMQVLDGRDGGTLFGFADPDGNTWMVQQIKARADKPLLGRQA